MNDISCGPSKLNILEILKNKRHEILEAVYIDSCRMVLWCIKSFNPSCVSYRIKTTRCDSV